MTRLLVAALLWSASFGLIKAEITGLNPYFVSFVRLSLSLLLFAPLLGRPPRGVRLRLALIGAVQFGAMYCLYISAYAYLQGHEIAVLTVTTPLFVVLTHAVFERRVVPRFWIAAVLAIVGGLVMSHDVQDKLTQARVSGVLLIQAANLCFGAGQVLYGRVKQAHGLERDAASFGWLYLGGLVVPLVAAVVQGPSAWTLPQRPTQWLALAYLGLIPSGIAFFLWNSGVSRVSNGAAAVLNNLKIPVAVVVAWLLFGETIDAGTTAASLGLLAAATYLGARRD